MSFSTIRFISKWKKPQTTDIFAGFKKKLQGEEKIHAFNRQPPLRKPARPAPPKFLNANEKDLEMIKLLNSQARGINDSGMVVFIDGQNGLKRIPLRVVLSKVDFKTHGVSIVSEKTEGLERFALVKIVDRISALRSYNDFLHHKVTNEILTSARMRSIANAQRTRNDPEVKFVRIGWGISMHDLTHQKTNEIESQIKKGLKVNIVVGKLDKADINGIEEEQHEEKISEVEKVRREKILETVQQVVQDFSPVTRGGVTSKVFITIKGSGKSGDKEEKKRLKEAKKQERRLKLQQRTEKKVES